MLTRRDFLRYLGCAAAAHCMPANAFAQNSHEEIHVNIPEFSLQYKDMKFQVSVGRPNSPGDDSETPTGKGTIYTKRNNPTFRYTKGPLKGQIVKEVDAYEGWTMKLPKEKMRALGIWIYDGKRWGWTTKFSIHSTTEFWNIGKPVSDGCVRMGMNDMLELYPKVPEGAKIHLDYETLKIDDNGFTVLPDIYSKGVNIPEKIGPKLAQRGKRVSKESLQNVLETRTGKYVRFQEL